MERNRYEEQQFQSDVNLTKLVGMLDDRDPAVRQSAAMYCKVCGVKAIAAKEVLRDHLSDPDAFVRIAVAEALYHIGELQCSFSTINDALRHDDPWVRLQALNVLQTFGYDVTPAIRLAKSMIMKDDAIA